VGAVLSGGELRQFFRRIERRSRPSRSDPDRAVSIAVPECIDWDIHRVATSARYRSGLVEIQTAWSLDDLYEAHDVLDMYDELEHLAARSRS